jgi:hypothetical protein
MSHDTETVVDAFLVSLKEFIETDSVSGGCSDIVKVGAIYFGDPGVIPPNLIPVFLVQPVQDTPTPPSETLGYEVRNIQILITLLVDAREFFDVSADEAYGDRRMVQVMDALGKWLRQKERRHLSGTAGVRDVRVERTDYFVQVRGQLIAKSAQLTAAVELQRPKN